MLQARDDDILEELQALISARPKRLSKLAGGCVGEVVEAVLEDGSVVVKIDRAPGGEGRPDDLLLREARMLEALRELSPLPVPRVLAASRRVLVLEKMPGTTGVGGAEAHAADLLAALHDVTSERYGFFEDTAIGSLPQKNPWTSSWVELFRDSRLLFMTDLAARSGRLPPSTKRRIERFAARIAEVVDEPPRPSLLHGDLWSGNVLSQGERITAFLDPAVCFGDAEAELAFLKLFSTVGPRFFSRYAEHRPLRPGFAERALAYNLYPLLVHVRLFGGAYVAEVEASLARLPGS